MTAPIFTPFKFGGVRFIAIARDGGNVHIVAQHGENYGAWRSIASFKHHMLAGTTCDLGKVAISVRVLS